MYVCTLQQSENYVATDKVKKKKKKKDRNLDPGDLTENGVIKEHNDRTTETQKLHVAETKKDGEAEEMMNEDELSPEERRVLERKLKKILRKEEKKTLKTEDAESKDESSKSNVAQTQALEYLEWYD